MSFDLLDEWKFCEGPPGNKPRRTGEIERKRLGFLVALLKARRYAPTVQFMKPLPIKGVCEMLTLNEFARIAALKAFQPSISAAAWKGHVH